jgi:hypothetical protein
MRIVALARKHRRHALAPLRLHHIENAQLVVDQYIMRRRIEPFDVGKLVLLVNVDRHPVMERLPEARALDLARLEPGVSVRQDHGQTPIAGHV